MSDGTIKTVLVGIIPAFPKLQFSTRMASNVCITPTEKNDGILNILDQNSFCIKWEKEKLLVTQLT